MTDTPFTTFEFPATGAPTPRTMPDRLAEIKNVVDFGADPLGGADSTSAIQAAVDWTDGADRGVIYFPLGAYKVSAPITFDYDGDLSICFRGEKGTNLFGNVDGYVFDRHFTSVTVTITIASPGVVTETGHGRVADAPVKLSTTGALPTGLVAGVTYYIKTVLSADTYTLSATPGGTVIATTGSQSGVHKRIANNTSGGRIFETLAIQNGSATGGCIRLGSTIGGVIRNCGLGGFICLTTEDDVGVSSQNISVDSCVIANNGTVDGSHYIIIGGGGVIQGCTLSGADTGVRAYGSGLSIVGCRSERCNTSFLFGVDSGDNPVGLSGFIIEAVSTEGCWTAYDFGGAGGGLCDGFVVAGCGALGHDSGNSGVVSGISGSQYGFRIRDDCARNGIFQGCTIGEYATVAGFSVGTASSRANLIIREVSSTPGSGGGEFWEFPSNAYTARFYNTNENPTWTYSQLPTGGDVLEGDEFDITDCNTATWGATAAGSGSNHVKVRFNGTNYTVVGK